MSNAKKMTYEEKLKALKEMHAHSHTDAKRQIDLWEADLARLSFEKEWYNHPSTKALRTTLQSQILVIDQELMNNEDLEEDKRKVLFKTKNVILSLLALLTNDPQEEIAQIDKSMQEELL